MLSIASRLAKRTIKPFVGVPSKSGSSAWKAKSVLWHRKIGKVIDVIASIEILVTLKAVWYERSILHWQSFIIDVLAM